MIKSSDPTPIIKGDGAPIDPGDYTIDFETGVITFGGGDEPGAGVALTATFGFYRKVVAVNALKFRHEASRDTDAVLTLHEVV